MKGGGFTSLYNDKSMRFRLTVSFENQSCMDKHSKATATPLFRLKENECYSLEFLYESFSCSYLNTKKEFPYKDIQCIETYSDGIIIYLKDSLYISASVENSVNHNIELCDIITLLKKRCRRRFSVNAPILYPKRETDERYEPSRPPLRQISFSLTDTEIKRLICYDYLFGEKMIVFIIAAVVFLLSAILLDIAMLIATVVFTVLCLVLSKSFFEESDEYVKNHLGVLQLLIFDELLVVRLRYTDLELEYNTVKRKKTAFGLWRLKCGDFFTLILPRRIVDENNDFFDLLYRKIN